MHLMGTQPDSQTGANHHVPRRATATKGQKDDDSGKEEREEGAGESEEHTIKRKLQQEEGEGGGGVGGEEARMIRKLWQGGEAEGEEEALIEKGKWKQGRGEGLMLLLMRPARWAGMMAREVDVSFVVGVMVIYGVSQGFGGSLYKIAGNYYWKDEQGVQPSASQAYHAIIASVWDWKPVWGLLTDLLPLGGYHRRPYFILSGLLSFISLMALILQAKVHDAVAVILFLLYMLGLTIADVTIDAEVAKKSHEKPHLATDIQSLCSMSASVGSFIGYSTSGFIVHKMGAKNALGLLLVSGALFLLLGFVLQETRQSSSQVFLCSQVSEEFQKARKKIWKTVCCPQVWRPTLYMFISRAATPSIGEAMFYWYTDKERGLGFTQEFVGLSFAVGSVGLFLGTLAYQNLLKNWSFRRILFWAQVLVFLGGTLELFFILRWNLKLHLSDSVFFLIDEVSMHVVGKLRWMPQLVLCAKLCPPGIEGTFFALLMSVDSVGHLTNEWAGALLQHSLGVTRDNFDNLWLAAVIRNIIRLLPLGVLFLVPDKDPSSTIITEDELNISTLAGDQVEVGEEEDVNIELVEKGHMKSSG